MSGQFDTESGGTVGIYRKKDRYSINILNEVSSAGIELAPDERWKLIYHLCPELTHLRSATSYMLTALNYDETDELTREVIRIVREPLDRIPTEAEITKRRRAAQRTKRQ